MKIESQVGSKDFIEYEIVKGTKFGDLVVINTDSDFLSGKVDLDLAPKGSLIFDVEKVSLKSIKPLVKSMQKCVDNYDFYFKSVKPRCL